MIQFSRTISFSGNTWRVKRYVNSQWGPGPNYFSDDDCNVWVDRQGRLHLKITRQNNRWYCAEVVCTRSFGYGTYRFYLDDYVDSLNQNVVLGLFTWSDNPAYAHREIDIEFARWGSPNNPNAYYTVQPWEPPGRQYRFQMPARIRRSVHSFLWQPARILFRSLRGHDPVERRASDVVKEWTFSGSGIPVPGDENPRMNLWLLNGSAPTDNKEVEVVISRFEFVPNS